MQYPRSIQNLIDSFSKLPTVGPKTAERFVFYLLKQDPEILQSFAQAMAELKEHTRVCNLCHTIAESDPCDICSNKKRDNSLICVISGPRDMAAIETTGKYSGLYHCLGGAIDSIGGIKPEQLNIKQLVNKVQNKNIKELILALNPTLEGETTSLYLLKLLKPFNIKITRLAKGLPMGANIEYTDEATLTHALKYRNVL